MTTIQLRMYCETCKGYGEGVLIGDDICCVACEKERELEEAEDAYYQAELKRRYAEYRAEKMAPQYTPILYCRACRERIVGERNGSEVTCEFCGNLASEYTNFADLCEVDR